jgi:hypothetical protein
MKLIRNPKYQFAFFLIIIFIINILQSNYTALLEDEAYYWVWSKDLAFGYFDHPPMVALWIKISSLFFDGELGVRFFSAISFSIMLVFIWLLIDSKKKGEYVWLFFLLVISVVFLNVYGFITTPDTPLLLFVVLFLFAYKQFLQVENWQNTLFMGFAMAGMLYSKYHGILVIMFIVLSNLSLLKNKKFWIAGGFGFLLFMPHLHWQYVNDFPSFKYHLFERSNSNYKIKNTLLHLVNQIAIVGITFPLIYNAFFKEKAQNLFEKSLRFIVFGFILFFLVSSFSGATQAQWTSVILIALIVVTFRYFVTHQNARKWLLIIGLTQFVIMLVARVFFANENISPIQLEPHVSSHWVEKLKEKTEGKPIVFTDSYRKASIYRFYTGIKTHSFGMLRGRKSQYNLGDFEENMQHENIYAVGTSRDNMPLLFSFDTHEVRGKAIPNYTTFQNVTATIDKEVLELKVNQTVACNFILKNTYDKSINLQTIKYIGVFQNKKGNILQEVPLEVSSLEQLAPFEEKFLEASFTVPKLEFDEETTFRISIVFYDIFTGYQGNKIKVKFEN